MHSDEHKVMTMLDKYKDTPQYVAYNNILRLLRIQYSIYDRNLVKDVLEKTTTIKKEVLVNNEHYNELQQEISLVKEYRYATMELQRLIMLISNPTEDIKNSIGRNSGDDSKGNNKWDESADTEIASTDIANYLRNNHQTEYIDKFDYTHKTFDDYVNNPNNSNKRKKIEQELNNALK